MLDLLQVWSGACVGLVIRILNVPPASIATTNIGHADDLFASSFGQTLIVDHVQLICNVLLVNFVTTNIDLVQEWFASLEGRELAGRSEL